MSRDLRDWIDTLRMAGELVEVTAPVDPRLEITEITDRVTKAGGPAASPAAAKPVSGKPGSSPAK